MNKDQLQKKILRRSWLLVFILGFVTACQLGSGQTVHESALTRIKKSGSIVVITPHNPYYSYHDQDESSGFEYELAQAFAKYLGVSLKVELSRSLDEAFERMEKNHFIATTVDPFLYQSKKLDFSESYLSIQQHIIFHKDIWDMQTISDLEGKTIHVRRGSNYEKRLRELQKEGLRIDIKTYRNLSTPELLKKVAQKKIEVTVANSHLAFHYRRNYPEIKVGFSIKEEHPIAWAVPKGEQELLNEINRFFETIKGNGAFDRIFERYYVDKGPFDYVDIKRYLSRLRTRLPAYENAIKNASLRYNLDWRLITAQIYQESHFNPQARSFSGVRGLMQLTIPTAQQMGIDDRLDPDQSITAGVKYMRQLYNLYNEAKEYNRLLISLAAYNVGPAHIIDAQEIARQMDLDPYKWSSLKKTLPLLSYPEYYLQSKSGYCRGYEPLHYVRKIMTYYDILKQKNTEIAFFNNSQKVTFLKLEPKIPNLQYTTSLTLTTNPFTFQPYYLDLNL